MFHWFSNLSLLLFSILGFWFSYTKTEGIVQFVLLYISGFLLGMFIMNLRLFVKEKKLNSYKRELEKESISSDGNAAKVKVLESKIEVLEKALDNALKKD